MILPDVPPKDTAHRRDAAAPRRTRGSQTRKALIETAIGLIARNGIAETSVLAITQELGLSNSNFYYYFENLDALLETVGHTVVEKLVEVIGGIERDDPAERIACGPLLILDYIDQHPDMLPILLRVIVEFDGPHADLGHQLRSDLEWGARIGRFPLEDVDVALHFCRSLIASAVRMRQNGGTGPLAVLTATHTLYMLGIDPVEARAIVAREHARRHGAVVEAASRG